MFHEWECINKCRLGKNLNVKKQGNVICMEIRMHMLDVEKKEMLSCMGFIGYINVSQKIVLENATLISNC
jgi:hypothetical protein